MTTPTPHSALAAEIAEAIHRYMSSLKNGEAGWSVHPQEFLPANVECDHAGRASFDQDLTALIAARLALEQEIPRDDVGQTLYAKNHGLICPKCGSYSMVWINQNTGRWTCHRLNCQENGGLDMAVDTLTALRAENAKLRAEREAIAEAVRTRRSLDDADDVETITRVYTECAKLREERDALKVEYESRALWIAKMNRILGYDNSDGFHSEPNPFEIAAALRTRAESAEQRAVKAEAELDGVQVERKLDLRLAKIKSDRLDKILSSFTELESERDALKLRVAELTKGGAGMIAVERVRQVSVEGWTPEHDDDHTDGSLRVQAAMLCCRGTDAHVEDALDRSAWTPPKPVIRQLVIAGALVAAEIDRLQRAAQPEAGK